MIETDTEKKTIVKRNTLWTSLLYGVSIIKWQILQLITRSDDIYLLFFYFNETP